MKARLAWLIAGLMVFHGVSLALAGNLANKVKVELEHVDPHPGMEPGMYVCAAGHLHIRGTVRNLADVPLGPIKVAGKALDSAGKILGTATASTEQRTLAPGAKTGFDLEFVTVTGPRVQLVKKHEIKVVDAPVAR